MTEVVQVVKEESARQTVILVFGAIGIVVSLVVLQALGDMDNVRTLKMGTALYTKRVCQKGADQLQEWADAAATVYNREKA
jgi:hypothetical protein